MRLPKRGQKGFTLIELLIVVAILGVLAAVVIPNVTRFFGKGEEEAGRTELHNVSLAVTNMMIDNGLTDIPIPVSATPAVDDMTAFPDFSTTLVNKGLALGLDGTWVTNSGALVVGYVLYGHDLMVDDGDGVWNAPGDEVKSVNYVNMATTAYKYTCDGDGTVHQYEADGVTEKTY